MAINRLLITLQIIIIVLSTFSANLEARVIRNRRSSLTLFEDLGFKLHMHNGGLVRAGEVKRLVPSGPNQETSPESPGRVVGVGEVKRLVPSGPNPETSPESPDRFIPRAQTVHYGGGVGVGEVKRLVPSGPNPETSPESPDRFTPRAQTVHYGGVGKVKRLVPSGPNPETSPESPDRFTPVPPRPTRVSNSDATSLP
ncbi:hypothetical protein POM88_004851 [Heracleum sosnowskyi]|uniref:Uncharacterized protein n=1 Tax=Heracleum sosnowskyi TaxID=360622 RepID=A0AAD8JKC8_9APIA|nr:hypothetical protein POM88_004851 [Heracleum sosnowskyi]